MRRRSWGSRSSGKRAGPTGGFPTSARTPHRRSRSGTRSRRTRRCSLTWCTDHRLIQGLAPTLCTRPLGPSSGEGDRRGRTFNVGLPLTARHRSNPLQLPAFLGRYDVKSTTLLAVMVAVYAVIMSYVVLLRYYSFQTHAFDLGIFSQAFSTALQGRLFYETPDQLLIPSGSFLGVHFNLLMFLLLPLYPAFPFPQTLLLLQTVVVALGAVPVFLLARRIVGSEKIALVMALVYLVNPAIINLNFYDFHLEAFLPLFLGMFFYFYVVANWRGYSLFLALSLITIDFAAVLVVAICLAHALRAVSLGRRDGPLIHLDLERKRVLILLGTVALALTVFYAVLSLSVVFSGRTISVPASLSGFVAVYQGGQAFYLKSEFWMLCLIPLMFLPLLAPRLLVMVAPWFAVTVLAGEYATSYSFGYQVAGAFVVPYLILAAVFAV